MLMLAGSVFVSVDCAEKADPKKSIRQIKKEIATMPVAELISTAEAYAVALRNQNLEQAEVTKKMREISVDEIFSEKTKPIKNRFMSIQVKSSALFQRYQLYIRKLQEKGVDTSKMRVD